MYRINEQLSKEENLELAKAYSEKAKEMLAKFRDVVAEANKQFPGSTFGLSKAKLEKHKSPNEAYNRLCEAVNTASRVHSYYRDKERMEAEKIKKQEQAEFTKKIESERSQLLNEAIKFCLDKGLEFGKDFNMERAIDVADDLAFQEEVKKRNEAIGFSYIGFSGQNCEDECAGWNPQDRRCECGNRRVSWTNEYSDFRNMEIYAEAW